MFDKIISLENLFLAWREFRRGKRDKPDVQEFERNLEDNLFRLHRELNENLYRHGEYQKFTIQDPKFRVIHKARVRDRVVHHAFFRILYSIFDSSFIYDSYSCRLGKGTHKAVERLDKFVQNMSRNFRKPGFALKCDIAKFFDSISHDVLKSLLARRIADSKVLDLLWIIIESFENPERERRAPDRKSGFATFCQYLFE